VEQAHPPARLRDIAAVKREQRRKPVNEVSVPESQAKALLVVEVNAAPTLGWTAMNEGLLGDRLGVS
jgi:hypothetical protein